MKDKIQNKAKNILNSLEFIPQHGVPIPFDIQMDFACMCACLQNEVIFKKQMENLEKNLEESLKKVGNLEETQGEKKIKLKEGKIYTSQHKVLTNYFEQWARDNGFNKGHPFHVTDGQTRRIIKLSQVSIIINYINLSDKLFRTMLLRQGYIFKDALVQGKHGEHSHTFGLYIVAEANKEYQFLKNSIPFLYSFLGARSCITIENFGSRNKVWNKIFDNTDETLSNPDNITLTLTNNWQGILSSLIRGRLYKRADMSLQKSTQQRLDEFCQKKLGANNTPTVLDNAVHFFDESLDKNIPVYADEIIGEIFYDPQLVNWYKTPKRDESTSLKLQVHHLFNPETWQEEHPESIVQANEIFLKIKNHVDGWDFGFYEYAMYIRTLFNPSPIWNDNYHIIGIEQSPYHHDEYLVFLCNEAMRIIIEADLSELKKYDYIPDPRFYTANNCYGYDNYEKRNETHMIKHKSVTTTTPSCAFFNSSKLETDQMSQQSTEIIFNSSSVKQSQK